MFLNGSISIWFLHVDDSQPGTPQPTSPTSSHVSMALSTGSGSGNTVPIARTDKHVVLAMSPARPKVASMQAKLDHTKIDCSLYEQVRNIHVFVYVTVFINGFTWVSNTMALH